VLLALCECGQTLSVFAGRCDACGRSRIPDRYRSRIRIPGLLVVVIACALAGFLLYRFVLRDERKALWRDLFEANQAFLAKRHEEAVVRFERYLRDWGELAEARYARGLSLSFLGRTEEAVTDARRALARRPTLDAAALFLARQALLRNDPRTTSSTSPFPGSA
jgi:tetratricopeptide (TPR) repeat protein